VTDPSMRHPVIFALSISLLGCAEEPDRIETIQTDDPSKIVRIQYEDGKVRRAWIMSPDSSDGMDIGFRSYGVGWSSVMKDGRLISVNEYGENGRPWNLTNFDSDSTRTGHVVLYHLNGALRGDGWKIRGKRVGIWREFDSTGVLLRADTFPLPQTATEGYPVRQ